MQQVWQEIANTVPRGLESDTLWATAAQLLSTLEPPEEASDGTLSSVDDFVPSDEQAVEESLQPARKSIPYASRAARRSFPASKGGYPPSYWEEQERRKREADASAEDPGGKRRQPPEMEPEPEDPDTELSGEELEVTDGEGSDEEDAPAAKRTKAKQRKPRRKSGAATAKRGTKRKTQKRKEPPDPFHQVIEEIVAHIHRCELVGMTKEAADTYASALQKAQKGQVEDVWEDPRLVYEDNMWHETTMYLLRLFGVWWRTNNIDVALVQKRLAELNAQDKMYLESDSMRLMAATYATVAFALQKPEGREMRKELLYKKASRIESLQLLWNNHYCAAVVQSYGDLNSATCVGLEDGKVHIDEDAMHVLCVILQQDMQKYGYMNGLVGDQTLPRELIQGIVCLLVLAAKQGPEGEGDREVLTAATQTFLAKRLGSLRERSEPLTLKSLLEGDKVLREYVHKYLYTIKRNRKDAETLEELLTRVQLQHKEEDLREAGMDVDTIRRATQEDLTKQGLLTDDEATQLLRSLSLEFKLKTNAKHRLPGWWILLERANSDEDLGSDEDSDEESLEEYKHTVYLITQRIVCEAVKTLVGMALKTMDCFVASMASVMLDILMLTPAKAGGEGEATAGVLNKLAELHATTTDKAARLLDRGQQKLCTVLPLVDGGGLQWQVYMEYQTAQGEERAIVDVSTVATLLHEMSRSDEFGFKGSATDKGRCAVLNDVVQLPKLAEDTSEPIEITQKLPSLTVQCMHVVCAMHLAVATRGDEQDHRHLDHKQVTECAMKMMRWPKDNLVAQPDRLERTNLPWDWSQTIEWNLSATEKPHRAVLAQVQAFANQRLSKTPHYRQAERDARHFQTVWRETGVKVFAKTDGMSMFNRCSQQDQFEHLMSEELLPSLGSVKALAVPADRFVLVASLYAVRCISVALADLQRAFTKEHDEHVGSKMFVGFFGLSAAYDEHQNNPTERTKLTAQIRQLCERADVQIGVDFVITATLAAFSREYNELKKNCMTAVEGRRQGVDGNLQAIEAATQTIAAEVVKVAASFAKARQFVIINERMRTQEMVMNVLQHERDPHTVLCRAKQIAPSASRKMRTHLLPCTPPSMDIATMRPQSSGDMMQTIKNREAVLDKLHDVDAWRVLHVHGTNALGARVALKKPPQYAVAWQILPHHSLTAAFEGLLIDLIASAAAQCPQIESTLTANGDNPFVTVCALLIYSVLYKGNKVSVNRDNSIFEVALELLAARGVAEADEQLESKVRDMRGFVFCDGDHTDSEKREQATAAAKELFKTKDKKYRKFLRAFGAACGVQGHVKRATSFSVQTETGAFMRIKLNDCHEDMQTEVESHVTPTLEHTQAQIDTAAEQEALTECEPLLAFSQEVQLGDDKPYWLHVVDKLRPDSEATLTYDELALLVLLRGCSQCPLGPGSAGQSWQDAWNRHCMPLPKLETYGAIVPGLTKRVFATADKLLHLTGAARLVSSEESTLREFDNVLAYSSGYYSRRGDVVPRPQLNQKKNDSAMRYLQVRSLTTPVSSVVRKGNKTHFDAALKATCDISVNRNPSMHECVRFTRVPQQRMVDSNGDMLWRCTLGHRLLPGLHGLTTTTKSSELYGNLQTEGNTTLSLQKAMSERMARLPSRAELPYIDQVLEKYFVLLRNRNLLGVNAKFYDFPEGEATNETMLTFATAVAFCAHNVKTTRPYDESVPTYFRTQNQPMHEDSVLGFSHGLLTLGDLASKVSQLDDTNDLVRWIWSLTNTYEVAHSDTDALMLLPDDKLGVLTELRALQRQNTWDRSAREGTPIIKPALQRAVMAWWHFCNETLEHDNLLERIPLYNDHTRVVEPTADFEAVTHRKVACLQSTGTSGGEAVRHELLEEHDYLWQRSMAASIYRDRPLPSLRSRYLMADALHAGTINEEARSVPYQPLTDSDSDSDSEPPNEQLDARYTTAATTRLLQKQFTYPQTMGDAYLSALHGWRTAIVELSPQFLAMTYEWNREHHGAAPLHYFASTVVARQRVGAKPSDLRPEFLCV